MLRILAGVLVGYAWLTFFLVARDEEQVTSSRDRKRKALWSSGDERANSQLISFPADLSSTKVDIVGTEEADF